jgi:hypothetical protein
LGRRVPSPGRALPLRRRSYWLIRRSRRALSSFAATPRLPVMTERTQQTQNDAIGRAETTQKCPHYFQKTFLKKRSACPAQVPISANSISSRSSMRALSRASLTEAEVGDRERCSFASLRSRAARRWVASSMSSSADRMGIYGSTSSGAIGPTSCSRQNSWAGRDLSKQGKNRAAGSRRQPGKAWRQAVD